MTDLQSIVDFLREETDGTMYQLLNRRMLAKGTAMDSTYREALRTVIDETSSKIEKAALISGP